MARGQYDFSLLCRSFVRVLHSASRCRYARCPSREMKSRLRDTRAPKSSEDEILLFFEL